MLDKWHINIDGYVQLIPAITSFEKCKNKYEMLQFVDYIINKDNRYKDIQHLLQFPIFPLIQDFDFIQDVAKRCYKRKKPVLNSAVLLKMYTSECLYKFIQDNTLPSYITVYKLIKFQLVNAL